MTADLEIRPAMPADAGIISEFLLENRSFHRNSSPDRADDFYTVAYQREQLEQDPGDILRFLVFRRAGTGPSDNCLVGSITFSQIVLGAFRSCYLGYGMDHRYTGQGYMTEALEAVIEHVFRTTGLHRVQANVMPSNRASIRVLEKLGFQPEGRHSRYLKINGKWEDHLSYAVIGPEP